MCDIGTSYSLRVLDNLSSYRNDAPTLPDKISRICAAEYGYMGCCYLAMMESIFKYAIGCMIFMFTPYYGAKCFESACVSYLTALWAMCCLITNLFFDRIYIWSANVA
jgi:hypothetical protein